MHTIRPGRPSLALDLMEEFRAFLADRIVLSLLNRRQIQSKDFIDSSGGAVTLTDPARKELLQAWQKRKIEEITHPYLSDNFTLTATYIYMNKDYRGSTPSKVEMSGGTIMLSDTNALRGINFSKIWFNLTGAAGSITIKQTDSKLTSDTSLAKKVALGYFRLDGVRINPVADGSNLEVLNAELKILSSNDRYLVIKQQGNSQIMEIEQPPSGIVIILH